MNITVDGVEYYPRPKDTRTAIVVCERGFVLVGKIHAENDYVVIEDCACIRIWGTTKGLGQLASSGTTDKTVLDRQPRTIVHKRRVVQIIDCEPTKWNL